MYGLVNKAIEDLVCSRFGQSRWERVKERADVDVEVFISNSDYPDAITYRLVAAASEELGMPPSDVLEAFGERWILFTFSRNSLKVRPAAALCR